MIFDLFSIFSAASVTPQLIRIPIDYQSITNSHIQPPPYPNPHQEAYHHVRSGNEVVTMDNRHLKNRFSSYQYVKDHFRGKAAIVSNGQTNDPRPRR